LKLWIKITNKSRKNAMFLVNSLQALWKWATIIHIILLLWLPCFILPDFFKKKGFVTSELPDYYYYYCQVFCLPNFTNFILLKLPNYASY
jgi:hypothetical protein